MINAKAILGAVLTVGIVLAFIADADAHASPCEVRSAAHIAKHGGLAADSAWHVANGELPTCGEERTYSAPASQEDDRAQQRSDEGKSRYCRKRWFC